jgi:hypothetical protein
MFFHVLSSEYLLELLVFKKKKAKKTRSNEEIRRNAVETIRVGRILTPPPPKNKK